MVNKKIGQVVSIPVENASKTPEPGEVVVLDEDMFGPEGALSGLSGSIESTDKEVNINIENVDEITFQLGPVPGAPEEVILEDEDEDDDEVSEEIQEAEDDEPVDDWGWEKSHGTKDFLQWLQKMISGVPAHSGRDTTGIERAFSYFKKLDSEISRAMSRDFKREIDAAKAEEARKVINDGMDRLVTRLDKLRKKYKKKTAEDVSGTLVKRAETSFTGGMTVNVPYFISFIARACVNATVSSGKDMGETFDTLNKEYKLDKREKAQVIQLVRDMGYPLYVDRLRMKDGKLEFDDDEAEHLSQYRG